MSTRPFLLVLACIAVLVMRLGGVHQHLCFDGSEAPSALHFVDGGLHHVETAGGDLISDDVHHHDVEVSAADDGVTKLPSLDLPVLALLIAVSLLLPLGRRIGLRPARPVIRLAQAPLHLRPPLRGPPRFSFA
ncbi:hypothetical protein [uncultured Nevskia sp.]|uniref:hypothetical protein n=1 Tax=uncultured Nevskia sp. TaxID=228950 RepID=UPI0025D139A2|nr:hypothetical protein [uncultured Nevskia sp.]